MKKEDLNKLDIMALKEEITKLKKELFDLRLNLAGGEIKDYSKFKKLRIDIARCFTFLEQKEKEENAS